MLHEQKLCFLILLLTLTTLAANATNIQVDSPGTLQSIMIDLDGTPTELTIEGTLNAKDLSYINSGKGKIASVSSLDLSKIDFACDGGQYAESFLGNSEFGMGTFSAKFFLSDECRIDTVSASTGLGGGNITYNYYVNDLAGVFIGNKNFKHIVLPERLSSIGDYIFRESCVESIVIPSQITSIPKQAFWGTNKLQTLSLPNIVEIEDEAFYQSSISAITADNLQHIGDRTFYESSIISIDLSHVETLGVRAFFSCKLFNKSVNLESLKIISEEAFRYSSISGVTFCPNLTHIGDWAFDGCESIRSFDLPEGLLSIGSRALNFSGSNITLQVPSSVSYIGTNALPQEWVYSQPTEDNIWYFGKVAYQFNKYATATEAISIKDDIISISPGFINDNNSLKSTLKSITLPQSMKYLGTVDRNGDNPPMSGIFTDCTSLESIKFLDGLETIGDGTFRNCTKLKIDYWPGSIKEIGRMAFYGCNGLSTVTIPENCEFVGHQAFISCNALYKVEIYSADLQISSASPFAGNAYFPNESIEQVVFGANVKSIPANLFNYCTNLVKVDFIGLPDYALKEKTISYNSALYFGAYSFANCNSLRSISIPPHTIEIGEGAFENVPLNIIYNFMQNPLDVSSSKLLSNGKNITVYVPENSLEEYLADPQWSRTNLIGMEVDSGIDNIQNDFEPDKFVECVNLNGIIIYSGNYSEMEVPAGIYILKMNDRSCKIIR